LRESRGFSVLSESLMSKGLCSSYPWILERRSQQPRPHNQRERYAQHYPRHQRNPIQVRVLVVSNEHPEHSARHGRKEKYAGQNPEEEPAHVPLPTMRLDDCPGLALPDSGEEALSIGPGL
jgi:hypothetical protein